MLRVGGLAFLLGVLLVVCEGRKAGTFSPTLDPIWIERGKEYQEWYDRWFLSGTFRFFFSFFLSFSLFFMFLLKISSKNLCFSCEKNCTYDISGWAPTMTACTSNGNLVLNSLCSSRTTYVDCMSGFFLHNPQDGSFLNFFYYFFFFFVIINYCYFYYYSFLFYPSYGHLS